MPLPRKVLLAAICAVAVAAVYAAQPILTEMGRDVGVAADALGWLVAAGQVGYVVGLVFAVPLGDLVDRSRLIPALLVLVAVGLLAVAAAPTAATALMAVGLTGLFAVVVQVTVAYAAAEADPGERGRVIGFVTTGVVLGILGSRLLAGMLTDLWGWRSVYLVLATLAFGLASVALVGLPGDRRPSGARYADVMRRVGRLYAEPAFLARGLIAFFVFASFGTLWSGMALPLSQDWRLSETEIGLFGIAGLAGALGAGRAGRWSDAGHANTVGGIALSALVVSWALVGQLPHALTLLALGIVVLDCAVQAVQVSNQHLLAVAHPDRVSATIGAYMVFYSLGSALGAASTTAAYGAAGWAGSTALGAAFSGAALLVWAGSTVMARRARIDDPDTRGSGCVDAVCHSCRRRRRRLRRRCEATTWEARGEAVPKTVIHVFRDDDDSVVTGTRVAQWMLETAATHGVQLEVFCFGPAQRRIGREGSEADATLNRALHPRGGRRRHHVLYAGCAPSSPRLHQPGRPCTDAPDRVLCRRPGARSRGTTIADVGPGGGA